LLKKRAIRQSGLLGWRLIAHQTSNGGKADCSVGGHCSENEQWWQVGLLGWRLIAQEASNGGRAAGSIGGSLLRKRAMACGCGWLLAYLVTIRKPSDGGLTITLAVHLLRPSSPDGVGVAGSGQDYLRHMRRFAYRCFLPDLTGFTRSHCAGPNPQRCLRRPDPKKERPRTGFNPAIADCGLQGTATSPFSTAKLSNACNTTELYNSCPPH